MRGFELMQQALQAYRGIAPDYIAPDDREQFVEYLELIYLFGETAFEQLIENAKVYEQLKDKKHEC